MRIEFPIVSVTTQFFAVYNGSVLVRTLCDKLPSGIMALKFP